MQQERAEPHGQFTGIDDFMRVLLQPWTHVDAIKAASTPKPDWFRRGGN